jgi:enamine deaminase RidA (YjgF/YER057c/UK114 family)
MSVAARLKALGIELPPVAIPAAAYVPFVQTGRLVFLSGHIAKKDGKPWVGQLGLTMSTEEGKAAARAIAIDLMGTLQAACGDLDRVSRIVKVMSLVNSTPTFTEQHLVTRCWAKCSVRRPAPMPAAPSAWRRSRWAPASRSS